MTMTPKERALRASQLQKDPILQEVISQLKQEKLEVILSRDPDAKIKPARHMMWALDELERRLQTIVDDEKFTSFRSGKAAPL